MSDDAVLYRIEIKGTEYFYVGSSGRFKQRKKSHLSMLKNGKHSNKRLQEFWNSGAEIEFCICNVGTREEMYIAEQAMIDAHRDSVEMLNVGISVKGGDNLSRNRDRAEIIARIAEGVSKSILANTDERARRSIRSAGENNPMYGKTHTPEVRALLSSINKGNRYNVGKKLSESQIAGMRERGKLLIGEKNPFHGKRHSDESRRKMSESLKGKPVVRFKSIEIDGVIYRTCTEAAKALGVSPALITHRLKSKDPKYSGYIIVKTGGY